LGQGANDALVQAARGAIVDVFDASIAAQLGGLESPGQRLVLAPTPLLVDQQAQPLQKTQFAGGRILLLRLESFGHAVEPHGQQFFDHRL
jgi:hypothetical protein